MNRQQIKKSVIDFHDKYYKHLLLVPLILIAFCFAYLGFFYLQNHDFFYKDVSLSGGTSATINGQFDITKLKNAISASLENLNIREISDVVTRKQIAVIIETQSDEKQTRAVLEDYLGYKLTSENSSFEFTGATLSQSSYQQLMIALLISFVCMAIVIFIQFRIFIPSITVITCAFLDILMTLCVTNLLGINISGAGIVALLMLIGYSVDTDILLTNKVLRREGNSVNKKIWDSFKTGITMTLTALITVVVSLLIVGSLSSVLSQIFLIMAIGLGFDILNTWLTNVSIIKWYVLRKKNEN